MPRRPPALLKNAGSPPPSAWHPLSPHEHNQRLGDQPTGMHGLDDPADVAVHARDHGGESRVRRRLRPVAERRRLRPVFRASAVTLTNALSGNVEANGRNESSGTRSSAWGMV
jgi:hypothetical protein